MKIATRWSWVLILMVFSIILSACGAQATAAPTVDPKTVYTQVAQTVQAQITGNAKLTPSATATVKPPDAATATLRPSSTAMPAGTVVASMTPQKAGTQVNVTPAVAGTVVNLTPQKTGTAAATSPALATATLAAAATQPGATSPDKMMYVSQKVADATTFAQNATFTMTWTIKNIGTTTWDNNYQIRLYAGTNFGADNTHIIGTVKPGDQTNVTMDMKAPDTVGEYNSIWVITNPDGRNFGSFTLNIKVK